MYISYSQCVVSSCQIFKRSVNGVVENVTLRHWELSGERIVLFRIEIHSALPSIGTKTENFRSLSGFFSQELKNAAYLGRLLLSKMENIPRVQMLRFTT